MEIYEALGPAGSKWQECEADEVSARRRMLLASVKKFTDEALNRKIAALARWRKLAKKHDLSPSPEFRPSSVKLGKFLDEVSGGGPTAAPQLAKALQWWQDYVGIPFPLADPLLAGYLEDQQ